MSLILEALRKLEREKQTPERGFLVLGSGAWTDKGGAGRPIVLFVLGLLVGGASLTIVLRSGSPATPTVAAVEPAPTAAAPTPHDVPTTLPATAATPAVAINPTPIPARLLSPQGSPSAAATPPAASAPAFTLQAISEKDGHPVALINDRLLREGDAIDGARVARISADSVELEIGGRRVVLRF